MRIYLPITIYIYRYIYCKNLTQVDAKSQANSVHDLVIASVITKDLTSPPSRRVADPVIMGTVQYVKTRCCISPAALGPTINFNRH